MKRITIRSVVFLVILSLVGLVVTNALYLHSHKLPDGTVIAHAHPFNKSQDPAPYKQHNHSSVEFFVLDHIQLLFGSLLILVLLAGNTIRAFIFPRMYSPVPVHFRGLPVTRPPPFPAC
ncbi:MAG: hypothetical protein JXA23_01765 [Bacteroidales bacterium]|nr:hypothetical protein [Bacteroidales bacterium]